MASLIVRGNRRKRGSGKARCLSVEFCQNGISCCVRTDDPFADGPRPTVFDSKDDAMAYFSKCLDDYAKFGGEKKEYGG